VNVARADRHGQRPVRGPGSDEDGACRVDAVRPCEREHQAG